MTYFGKSCLRRVEALHKEHWLTPLTMPLDHLMDLKMPFQRQLPPDLDQVGPGYACMKEERREALLGGVHTFMVSPKRLDLRIKQLSNNV